MVFPIKHKIRRLQNVSAEQSSLTNWKWVLLGASFLGIRVPSASEMADVINSPSLGCVAHSSVFPQGGSRVALPGEEPLRGWCRLLL